MSKAAATPRTIKKWGAAPQCPGCKKSVYPLEQVFAADRKPFHKPCIQCSIDCCRLEMKIKWIIEK